MDFPRTSYFKHHITYRLGRVEWPKLVFGLVNPISGKVWNDVIRQDRVNLTRKFFRLHKYPKQPQSDHNLFPVVYFDICLAIGIKITLKWSRFLMKLAIVWKYSKLIFFKPKHMKTSNLWLQMSYIPKKAENIHNKYLVRKSKNLCKKRIFFSIFPIFITCSRTP